MKLNISEKLRRLRRDEELTQEQLADELGVSVQAVSRWECATTYPDIEMLPLIASHFGITVDELLGVEKSAENERLDEYRKKLVLLTNETERIELLREMHRAFPNDDKTLFDLNMSLAYDANEDHLDEQRRTSAELLSRNIQQSWRDNAVSALIAKEEDDRVPELLDRYTTDADMRRLTALESRYGALTMRGKLQTNEFDRFTQLNFLYYIHEIFNRLGKGYLYDVPVSLRAVLRELEIIDMLTGTPNSHFARLSGFELIDAVSANPDKRYASGDGVPDLWTLERFYCGVQVSCYLSVSHKTEEAQNWLCDAVSLYEKFYALPDMTELTYRCTELCDLVGILKTKANNGGDICPEVTGDTKSYSYRYIEDRDFESDKMCPDDYMHQNYSPVYQLYPLLDEKGWQWFNPIRNEPRYIECIERMKKLFVPINEEKGE